MRSVVDSIYKVCNGYTWKTSLQVVFALVAFLPQTESAVENQEVANLRVQVVFTDLPEPYLPGIGRAYSLDDLGVEFRPSSHSRDDEEFRDSFHTPPDFGVLSGHDHNRGQLCLTLDQTDLKARRVEENLTSIGLTVVSQDDKQTTSDNRRAELSTSVCAHGSLSNDSYIIAIIQQERKTEAESYVQLRANTFDRRWPHKHLKPDKMAEASFVYTDDDPLVEHFLFSPDCEYILNEQQDNPQNFGASSRTGAAQEDFDEHNGAYASVESEKGVHERRFRYAGHVEQNGHWKLEIENTNQETTHSIQNCATKKNFGASSRTGAAKEDFDEHNGAYASVESEKGVHERRFRYAGHVEQNGHWKLEIENTNQETTHSIQNCATKKNFGASSRTGAAKEDFDEHNGAYASVESEKGVHERRFRYAGHVEQNGHWKLEIENTNQETTHSIQNCATKKNFGASSRTGAAQEDFDEHNGAYASVESEKGVHERRFRYAGHVEQNGHWKLEIENTNQETTHSIQNCATKKNFGASSRTGAAQEDFDEHNGAYASVESEKGVHERRFRYAGHVEQNGHWKLEIENTNQETTHSIQNCATKKYDMQRRHCPHGGRGNNHIGKNHSETNGEGHAAGLFMHKCQGPSSSTAAPIDKKLVNDPLESDEVRTVLSKGYKRTDVASVVEAILKAGGIITVDKLMRALGRIRARRIVRK